MPSTGWAYNQPGPTLAPDGDALYIGTGLGTLLIIDPASGKIVRTIDLGSPEQMVVSRAVISADAKAVYVVSADFKLRSFVTGGGRA